MPQPPSDAAQVLTGSGTFTQAWRAFFARLGGASAGPSQAVTADGSPCTFTAPESGVLALGAPVTGLSLVRGRDTVALIPTASVIPLAAGDRLLITYSTRPPITFLPS